jgi:hypothetical protein
MTIRILFISVLTLGCWISVSAQNKPDIWKPLQSFIGDWKGTGGGEPGTGEYERSYKFIFDGKFIEIRNRSTYPKQAKNPKGEVHEDVGYISYDKARKLFILRQFHKEGFVNQFKLESISADGKTLVFISESIENIPAGYRAKETYQIAGDNEFTETFEIAEPAKEFQIYTKTTLKRTTRP